MKKKTTMMIIIVMILGVLLFAACAPKEISLVDTSWTITEINGEPVLEGSEITMEFTADQVGGKASCNNYFASYTLEDDKLTFGPAGSTMMWCAGIMEQETLFLSSLDKIDTVAVDGNQLTLHLNDGGSIVMVEQ